MTLATHTRAAGVLIALALVSQVPTAAHAQQAPAMTPPQMVSAQQKALAVLSGFDGRWQGEGWMVDTPGDTPRKMVEFARVGPMLDRAVRFFEVQGRTADGAVGFHSVNNVSFNAQRNAYVMTARAAGRSGDFRFAPTADGYVWEIGGDGRGLRYTATLKDGVWTEVGMSLAPDRAPITVSEMKLTRIGATDWPEGVGLPAR